jgi:hypothetical protein
MPNRPAEQDDLKRKLRRLKKLEIKIRFGTSDGASAPDGSALVWDTFFDLHSISECKSKYSLQQLSAMGKDELRSVTDEYFFAVYYQLYKENGIAEASAADPGMLSRFGLPPDADEAAIKKKFHELAIKYHPDTGGDAASFIELMDNYRKLIDKGK